MQPWRMFSSQPKQLIDFESCKLILKMDTIYAFILAQREEDTEANVQQTKKTLRQLNVLDLSDSEFIKNFRVNKELFKYLVDEMEKKLPSRRSDSLSASTKLACVLHFLAEGGSQEASAKDYRAGIGQSTFCDVLSEFLNFMEENLCTTWIVAKMTEEEENEARVWFYEKSAFPNTTMAIDGTHVRIIAPKEDKHLYLNRKHFHSLNVMVACDHKMTVRYIDARYAGSNHDSHIWAISGMRQKMITCYQNGSRNMILGDAGYPLEPWIMVPYRSPTTEAQTRFNRKHSSGRIIIERTFGVMKNRWRCLLKELHYSPQKACQIVNVCAALHNMCLKFGVPSSFDTADESDSNDDIITPESEIDRREWKQQAENIRLSIMNSL